MAHKVQILLVDDLDGGEAEETVTFSVDGTFMDKSRKPAPGGRKRWQRATPNRERSAEIRAWAKGHGIKINDRGRIPATVIEKYEPAH